MYYLIAALVALMVVAVLMYTGILPSLGKSDDHSTVEELRQLIAARNSGTLTAEEFDHRQAELLAGASTTSGRHISPKYVAVVIGGLAGIIAIAIFAGVDQQRPPEPAKASLNPTLSLLKKSLESTTDSNTNSGGDLGTMANRLAKKMEADPSNGEGWLLLARTYLELRQHANAADAFAKAAPLLLPDAKTLADWADAYVVAHDRKWDDTSRGIVKQALAADPKHLKSLALAGSEAFERGDYKTAISHWKKMKAVAPPDSMDSRLADANIEEASNLLKANKPGKAAEKDKSASANRIEGTVSLAPALQTSVAPTDTIFVVAKSTEGGGAPLAVKRYQASELPIRFALDESAAMSPERSLADAKEVMLSARLSKTGDAMPGAGDRTSETRKTRVPASGIQLELR